MRKAILFSSLLIATSLAPLAHATNQHNHTMAMGQLTEAGQDAFGTIQEVIRRLEQDPHTDWNNVNLEALRQHLLDMQDMTLNVDVLKQQPIEHGLQMTVKATTPRAQQALQRVFQAHPEQLKRESGWTLTVQQNQDTFTLTATTAKPEEIAKIRGLGYIGLMAYGHHHQTHHWLMATGAHPHD